MIYWLIQGVFYSLIINNNSKSLDCILSGKSLIKMCVRNNLKVICTAEAYRILGLFCFGAIIFGFWAYLECGLCAPLGGLTPPQNEQGNPPPSPRMSQDTPPHP